MLFRRREIFKFFQWSLISVVVILVSTTFACTFGFYMYVLFFIPFLLNLCLFEKQLIMWNVVMDDKKFLE
jgi:hypothetical protein